MYNLYIPLCGLILNIILLILYRVKISKLKEENKYYFWMIVDTFVMTLFCIIAIYLLYIRTSNIWFVKLSNKIECFAIYNFFANLFMYIVSICKGKTKKVNYAYKYSNVIMFFVIFLAEVSLQITDDLTYMVSVGPVVNITTVVGGIVLIFSFILSIKNRKIIGQKIIPIVLLLFFIVFVIFLRGVKPEFVCLEFLATVAVLIMYHTLENPDLKLLEEVHKSKEISDNANEEKTMFLYNMTQEIRNTMNDIDDNADMILESSNLDDDKEYAREIKIIASKFNTMTNEMFDVSKLDSAYIKVYNSKYNIKNIFKEIVTMYNNKCKSKNIDFRVNIDHDVPMVLYGDSIGLKEVLTIIMDNSVKYTKEGFIEFGVNTIIKNDICRLIVTIEDSGIGIKSEDINKIKTKDKSLSKANKLITLMNGTMMISSNYGLGTKVKVILDQKIEVNKNEDVVKYEEVYDDIKLLMVDDSDSGIKIIDKLIRGSSIKMDFAINGKECIDKIKSYGKYDIILLDEQLTQISAMELIKKIKNIRNFNIPVILLTKDNSYEYNDEYKKIGFVDYLLKPVKKEELLNKINKYVKKDK